MQTKRTIILGGILVGMLMGIITPLMLQSPFITGDSVIEFLTDGGSYFMVTLYFLTLGIIIGGIVSFMMNIFLIKSKNRE